MTDEHKEWTKRKTDREMDLFAEEIFITFAELGFDDAYIENKRRLLVGKNRFDVLLWCNDNLDSKCKAALAKREGIDVDDLNKAISIIALIAKL